MQLRLPRIAARSLAVGVPTLGLLVAFTPAAGASTAASPMSAHARAVAAARAFLEHLSVGTHATNHVVSGSARRINGLTQVHSTNWSGYADTSSTFSAASGHWTEPSVSCTSQTSYAAFWVGIDGFSSGSVEQDGTLAECSGGSAFYFTWWEMYPKNSIQVVGSTLQAGDSITASVTRSGTTYTLKVTDSSRSGDSFSTSQSCSNCANSSAEWIAEAPSSSSGVLPLADFHTWSESSASVTGSSGTGVISSFADDEITMVDSSGLVKAQPGSLNSSGNGFSVSWVRSS
ncbi:MAG TPA: G1 family glutamic endopeptidase [Streptosporangiaceae bacterium]|nr:G1 family glutamic endopeptidase [Streptosporangiaceae bacterium]